MKDRQHSHTPTLPHSHTPVLGLALLGLSALAALGADYVWIEGEATTSINVEPQISAWGRVEFFSDGKWLQVQCDAEKVEQEFPEEGARLAYEFPIGQAGRYEIWNRLGYEFVRSPFEWRLDGGEWAAVSPEELTTDLMEFNVWNELAWLKLGEKDLAAGDHKLEIRVPRTKDDQGQFARVLYASDALCLYRGQFHPNGQYKPDEDYRDERDEEAARHVFQLPGDKPAPERVSIPLEGLWEVCRHDEQRPGEVAAPIQDFPEEPHWKAIPVPGDKNTLRPDLEMAHRLWYRTRVEVPESLAGRSFHLVFPQNNLNTTVYVNGIYCGFHKNPFARFQIDVTKGIRPGVNEVWVGIRDAWYGYSTNPHDPLKLRRKWNLPVQFFHQGWQDLAYPIWNHPQSGILVAPEFVAAGPVYAADVFVKPSVARKELAAEVTLLNTTEKAVSGELQWQAVNAQMGAVEQDFPPQRFTLAAGAEQTVALMGVWPNPKLWWPDEPNLYHLRTTVVVEGKPVDVKDTTFGFREWSIDGKNFQLNGVTWHGWADCHTASNKEDWLAFYRRSNQRMMRFWGTSWQGMPPEEALEFFDRNGVVVRRSGLLDGEAIGYFAVENDPDLRELYGSEIKMELMHNWRDQIVAQVRGERNHPSILIWSIENEWLYINCINLYGHLMDEFEAVVTDVANAVRAVDPTRPVMVDGGGATKAQTLPVHGDHYVVGRPQEYPDLAYQANPTGGGRGRWVWDEQRPRFIGEDFYMTGNHPEVAYFEGEGAFAGKPRRGVAIWNRILQEGYRWAEYGAWQFWLGQHDTDQSQYLAFAPRAVFCRQWDWTFASGQKVKRTFGIFNDTHSDDPITFTWTLMLGDQKVATRTQEYHVPAGTNLKFDETIPMPPVESRQEGKLYLKLTVKGAEVFLDVKPVSVLKPRLPEEIGSWKLEIGGGFGVGGLVGWWVGGLVGFRGMDHAGMAGLAGVRNPQSATRNPQSAIRNPQSLLVFDPQGAVVACLKSQSIPFTPIDNLDNLPEDGQVLVVGPEALDEQESTSSRLAAYAAAGGRRVLVLEQTHPLRYQGLPAEMEPAANEGRTAFGEDLEHPVLRGLQQKDFFTWGENRLVYRHAYLKPTRGARSLVQCDDQLRYTALAEVPVGEGLLLLCQLRVGENLDTHPVAQQLFFNLLGYAASYRLEFHPVTAAVHDNPLLEKALDAIGLQYMKVDGPLQALSEPGLQTAIVSASPANLKTLADNLPQVEAFTKAGGALVLCGLTPEGLADYNRIVGVEHLIRPFKRERVLFPPVRDRLTAGLTTGDVVLYSSERIFSWTAGNYVVSDMFSYVVDYDEVAAFGKSPFFAYDNITNGFVSADGWPLIINFPKNADDSPYDVPITLPKPQTITEFTWIGNTFYWPQTRVNLIFDGKQEEKLSFQTEPNAEPQTFPIDPPRTAQEITLQIAEWIPRPGVAPNIGIDNIYLKAQRPPEFYQTVKPMLNVGGLMHYLKGPGHIVLCNLLFKETEDVPENADKKRHILATILRNLKAPFAGGRTIIAGANLEYHPIDLSKVANQYRDERGWFGDRNFTFKDLPPGDHSFAGVRYHVYEFPTSPVPTVVMLGGPGVPGNLPEEVRGIPVNRRADALFFLHTARLDARRNAQEVRENKHYEMARYVITYADGQTAIVPIYAEIDVDDYRQPTPAALPGAQIAWVRPYGDTGFSAVAYSKQWNNPRPEVEIRSVDLVYGPDRRGVPALLALTAATADLPVHSDQPYAITFPAQEAKFVRFVVRATNTGNQACLDELEVYGPAGKRNLALARNGGRASASSCLAGYAQHAIEHLNDGEYGNRYSWIPAGTGEEWAQIELPDVAKISKVVFSRDRLRQYGDRVPTEFEIRLSRDGKEWKTVGKVQTTAISGALQPGAVPMIPPPPPPPQIGPDGRMIPVAEPLDLNAPRKDELGFPNLALSPQAKPSASSLLPGFAIHQIAHLNDGLSGNSHSWIGAADPSWAEIDLGDVYWVYQVAFGSDTSGQYSDRAATDFSILTATRYDPDTEAPTWKPVFKQAGGPPIHRRTAFKFRPLQARWIRIAIEAGVAGPVRIDEIEVFGQKDPIPLEKIGPLDSPPSEGGAMEELLRYAFLGEEHAWLKTYGRADLDPTLVPYNGRVKEYPRHVGDDRLPLPPLASVPKWDGRLDDPCWTEASRGVARVAYPSDFDLGPLVEYEVWAGWREGGLYLAIRTHRLLSSHVAVVSGADWQGCGVVALTPDGLVFNTYTREGDNQPRLEKATPVEGAFDLFPSLISGGARGGCFEFRLPLALFAGPAEAEASALPEGLRVGLGLGGQHTSPLGRPVEFVFSPLAIAEQEPGVGRTFQVRLAVPPGGTAVTVSGNAPGLEEGLMLTPGRSKTISIPGQQGPIGPEYELTIDEIRGAASEPDSEIRNPYTLHLFRYDPLERTLVLMGELLDRLAGKGLDVRAERAEWARFCQQHERILATGEYPPQPPLRQRGSIAAREAFFQARLAKRRLFFREPDLAPIERILFVKRHAFHPSHIYTDYTDAPFRPGGGIFVLDVPRREGRFLPEEARLTRLFEAKGGIARDPVANFDLSQIYFGYRPSAEGFYHLMAMNPDGSGLRPLTDGPFHDFYPCPLPDGGLAFISTRCTARVFCFRGGASVLFRMEPDGRTIRPLSFASLSEWAPSVMRDGRIIWTRWEYVDKGADFSQTLWSIRPDGTQPELVFGNTIIQPNGYACGREVPGTSEICCTLVSHFGDINGPIALLDLDQGRFNPQAIKSLTPEVPWPGMWPATECFRDPFPLARDYFLCAHAPRDRFGLYVIDRFGNRELIYLDPKICSMAPTPFRPTTPPPALPNFTLPSPGSGEGPGVRSAETGRFLMLDVYRGLEPTVSRGRVKWLQVVEEVRHNIAANPNFDHVDFMKWYASPVDVVSGPFGWPAYVAKAPLGIVPVEEDGSAHFLAPAGKVLYFQALDEDFNELQRMRSVVQLQPGETRTCVGCHEGRHTTPPSQPVLALKHPPREIQPPPWGAEPFSFEKVVQPVLDQHCVRCHNSQPGSPGDLTGTLDRDRVPASYRTLIAQGWVHFVDCGWNSGGCEKREPLTFGTVQSKLWPVLEAGHYGVQLTAEEKRRIKCWTDLNCPLWPDYHFRPERPGPSGQVAQAR